MDIKLAEYPSTEALIEALLKNKNLGQVKNITVKDLDIAGASGVGSVPVLAEVELENQGGKCEKLKLFVKVCEKGTPPWWAQEVAHTMTKEVTFYEDMLPKICKFQVKSLYLQCMKTNYINRVNNMLLLIRNHAIL